MSYSEAQRVSIRRYCGYPMFGAQPTQAFGYRYFQHYGTLEFRMSNGSAEEAAAVIAMLATLAALEADLVATTGNLDTASAGPWVHNSKELRDRVELYSFHRLELCNFFGVPPGPSFPATGLQRVV